MSFQQLYEQLVSDIDYDPIIAFLETYLKKDQLTLDAGCGTGVFLVPLVNKGYRLEGIDIDADMLSIAHEKLTSQNLFAPLYEHDLKKPIYKKYDQIILMNDVVNYFKGVKTIFKQLKNALNPNGFMIFDCYKYEYLSVMDGYIESESTPVQYSWSIAVKNETMTHLITGDHSYTVKQTIKPLDYYLDTLKHLSLTLEILDGPDERKHYIKASL